jgi:hypothetical protein
MHVHMQILFLNFNWYNKQPKYFIILMSCKIYLLKDITRSQNLKLRKT